MAKIVDITDKLNFEEKPQITVKGEIFTVNNEAETILKIIPLADEGSAKSLAKIAPMLLNDEDYAKLSALKLDLNDFGTFIKEAVQLATGAEAEVGEAPTRATT